MISKDSAELIREAYYEYAKYINLGGRTVCSETDSLKAVQRRILYAAYTIGKTNSYKFTKTATVVGETIGKYNPHGDASCAGAVAGMVKDGLMEGKGNFGSNIGIDPIEPAAMRYTECRLSELIKKLAFKYINDVPYHQNDLGFQEPEYLPTPLPLNLCHFSNTESWVSAIGFGLSYTLPKFEVEDLYNCLKSIVLGKEDKTLPIDSPIELINEGKTNLNIRSKYTVSPNKKSITIEEFPPMKKTIRNMLKPFEAMLTDSSKNCTKVEVSFNRGVNADDYDLDSVLTGNQAVDMYFHNNQIIKHYSLKEILLSTYANYKKAVEKNLEKCYNSILEEIRIASLLTKVKPYLNPLNEETQDRVVKNLNISDEVASKLLRHSVKQICESEKKVLELESNLKEIKQKRDNLDKFCLKEIKEAIN